MMAAVSVFALTTDPNLFPDPSLADESGLLAVGGDLSAQRLINAYGLGIFPWFEKGQPLLWWSPDPRLVLHPNALHVGRSLRKVIRAQCFEIRLDTNFEGVIDGCAERKRPGQRGTWITSAMRAAYVNLHSLGVAHSAEAYLEGRLVGGLYGVSLGQVFFGESMFANEPDASKVAFAMLVKWMDSWGVGMIDCQVTTSHLLRFGAKEIPRAQFLGELRDYVRRPGRIGRWTLDLPSNVW
jgi:leucyl/phenylalanyl-tRNA--protein transferase